MRVVISTIGTFHSFDMARQLERAGVLRGIYTAYPRFKLGETGIPQAKVHTFPWFHGPYMAGWVPRVMKEQWEFLDLISFDAITARSLADCDVLCGLSGSSLSTGRTAQGRGGKYICDRGSTHVRHQDAILRAEYERWGLSFNGIPRRILEREEEEYEQADAIFVPSRFVLQTFVDMGVSKEKLHLAPYGVDLTRFSRTGEPGPRTFDAIFVGTLSVRKGAQYLFDAYEKLYHPAKSLTIVGHISPDVLPELRRFLDGNPSARTLGHVPQTELKNLLSTAHVLVLPSVEEGLALVQAQAMACGCPVVASESTGAADLFSDGVEGFIVPPQDVDTLCAAIQKLADDPSLRYRLSRAALARVNKIDGWNSYGATIIKAMKAVTGRQSTQSVPPIELTPTNQAIPKPNVMDPI